MDFNTVREMALALSGVEEATAYGSPALKVRGKLLACIPTHKTAEPGSLAVSVDFERRVELLASAPDVYYVKEHYADHPIVLVRLARISPDALHGLLTLAWQFVTKTSRGGKKPVRKKQRSR